MGRFVFDPTTGLMLPRRVPLLLGKRLCSLQPPGPALWGSAAATPTTDIIQMLFEGPEGSATYLDTGTAGSIWTQGGGAIITSTAGSPQGIRHLTYSGGVHTDYIDTAQTLANTPGASGGDFFIGFWASVDINGGNPTGYIFGLRTGGGGAADSAFFFYTGGTGPYFYYSDGSTLSSLQMATTNSLMAVGAMEYLCATRKSGVVYLSRGGVPGNSFSWSGSFPQVSGGHWRIGAIQVSPSAGAGVNMDMLQVMNRCPFANPALSFTPQTSPL